MFQSEIIFDQHHRNCQRSSGRLTPLAGTFAGVGVGGAGGAGGTGAGGDGVGVGVVAGVVGLLLP